MTTEANAQLVQAVGDAFFELHLALHPESSAIRELLAAGVAQHSVLALYPFTLEELAPRMLACYKHSQPPHRNAFLAGEHGTFNRWLDLTSTAMKHEHDTAVLAEAIGFVERTAGGQAVLALMVTDPTVTPDVAGHRLRTAAEIFATAARWHLLPELHGHWAWDYATVFDVMLRELDFAGISAVQPARPVRLSS